MTESSEEEAREPFRLGDWTVDPELGRITRGEQVVQLRPRAMDVLVCLADFRGRLASKQHLIDTVWKVEFVSENALTQVIAELRTELGDDAEEPAYIETIPRRGYRIIAPVEFPAADRSASRPESTQAEAEGDAGERQNERGRDAESLLDRDAASASRAVPVDTPSRRRLLPAAAAVLVVVVAIGLWLSLEKQPTTDSEPGVDFDPRCVVVAEFENRIGDPAFDDFGTHVADSITALLRTVDRVTVATGPRRSGVQALTVSDENAGADSLHRLARATRAGLSVTGACYRRGDQVEIQASIVDPWRDEVRQTFEPVRAPLTDPASAVELLRQRVAGALALHVDDILPLGLSRAIQLAAYRQFSVSLHHWGADRARVIAQLERALTIEPAFHLAREYLIRWYLAGEMFHDAQAELEVLEGYLPSMTPFDRLVVVAARAYFEGRPLEALRALRESVSLAPGSYWFLRDLGLLAIAANCPREAVEALSRIPYGWTAGGSARASTPFYHLCFAHHMLGEYETQLRVAAESQEHFPDRMVFRGLQESALACMGRFDELDRIVQESTTISVRGSSWGFSHTFTARELRAHGHRERSLELAERVVRWYREHPDEMEWTPWGTAWGYAAALHAAERWREAREVAAELVRVTPDDVQCLGLLGVLEARIGNQDEARRITEQLLNWRAEDPLAGRFSLPARTYWRACIAAQFGHRDEAMRLLQQASAEGGWFSDEVHRDLNLEPLWDYPPFQEFIRPKG